MKRLLASLLLLVASIAGVAIASNPNNCQKPNPNKKACLAPVGNVPDCTTLSINPDLCTGSKQYNIMLFPDGAVGDPYSGRWTTDQSTDCYRFASCKVNHVTKNCENLHGYGNWFKMPKTVLDTSRVCPPPPGPAPGPGPAP